VKYQKVNKSNDSAGQEQSVEAVASFGFINRAIPALQRIPTFFGDNLILKSLYFTPPP
jgi:hypothetical protein